MFSYNPNRMDFRCTQVGKSANHNPKDKVRYEPLTSPTRNKGSNLPKNLVAHTQISSNIFNLFYFKKRIIL
jgi:hypothetical protein